MIYFEHFCKEHIFILILISLIISSVLFFLSKDKSGKATLITLRTLAILHFCCEFLQDILLVHEGFEVMRILPLHLCNLGIFINLGASFSKGKIRAILSEISVMLIMPGALGALLFPDWNYRPFWNWLPLMCFFTHMILMTIPLIYITKGICDIRFKHFYYSVVFMLLVTPPIYKLDVACKQNFIFFRYPVLGSPLEWIYNLFTPKHYIFGLFLLLITFLAFEYTIAELIRYIHKRRNVIADQRSK